MTPTTADKHIREVWAKDVLSARQFKQVVADFVDKSWAKELQGWGDVIHKARIPNIENTTKTPGTVWAPYVYTDTEQTLTINKYEVTGFKCEAITRVLANPSLEENMQKSIGYSLGLGVETNLVNLFQSFSQTVGTAGVEVTWGNLTRAKQYLSDSGVTEPSAYFFSPAVINGLRQNDLFINSLYRGEKGPRAVEQAYIADILGSKVYEVPYLRAAAAGQHDNALMCNCTLALAMAKEPTMFSEFQSLDLADVIGSYQIYGVTEVDRYSPALGNITATDEDAVLIASV